jgi:hypothetical protein
MTHHVWEIELEVGDLSTPERLARLGLEPPRPGRRTWPPYQAVGEQLFRAGAAGLLAPSAGRPRALITCIFDAAPGPPAAVSRSGPSRSPRLPHPPPA